MKTFHMSLDVAGALTNWRLNDFRHMLIDKKTGRHLTPREVKRTLAAELALGHRMLPLTNEPCEGFSDETGCPGHAIRAEGK